MTDEIKACPFCGHVGLHFRDGDTNRWGEAYCFGCGASAGDTRRKYPDEGTWHAEAIKQWNTRAAPPAPAVEREPLTLQQLHDAARQAQIDYCLDKFSNFQVALARAIEKAHGIGITPKGST